MFTTVQIYPRAMWPHPRQVLGYAAWGGVALVGVLYLVQVGTTAMFKRDSISAELPLFLHVAVWRVAACLCQYVVISAH